MKEEPHTEGSNDSLMDAFFEGLMSGRKRWVEPGKTFCKSLLVEIVDSFSFSCCHVAAVVSFIALLCSP